MKILYNNGIVLFKELIVRYQPKFMKEISLHHHPDDVRKNAESTVKMNKKYLL